MKINIVIAAFVALCAGCGAQMAQSASKPSAAPQETREQNERRLKKEICFAANIPDERCYRYANTMGAMGTGGDKSAMLVTVNDEPTPVRPIGPGAMPGKLLPSDEMFLPLSGCERPGRQNGRRYCSFTIRAEYYPNRTLSYVTRNGNRLMQRFKHNPAVDSDYRTCYRTEVRVYNDGYQMGVISHMAHDEVPCDEQVAEE